MKRSPFFVVVLCALCASPALCQPAVPLAVEVPVRIMDARPAPFGSFELAEPLSLPFTLGGAWILVDGVRVNGKGPFRFMLDTGASGGGRVDTTLAESLGLTQIGEARGASPMGTTQVSMPVFELEHLEIAGARWEKVNVASRDYNNAQGVAAQAGHIDGILGLGLFKGVLLTIDYPRKLIGVEHGVLPEPNGNDVIASMPSPGLPSVRVTLGGIEGDARIDTGSPATITIGRELAKQLTWRSAPVVIGQARTVSGAFDVERGVVEGQFRMGSIVIDNPEVDVVQPHRGLTIGSGVLGNLVITLDLAHSRVRFQERAAPQ